MLALGAQWTLGYSGHNNYGSTQAIKLCVSASTEFILRRDEVRWVGKFQPPSINITAFICNRFSHSLLQMQDFPQELVHQVVDNLSDDPKCLRACRLVCRAWNISASAYLFRSLDLSVPNPTSQTKGSTMENLKRLSDLVQILQTSRDIPYCTKEVTLGRTSLLAPEADNHIAYGRLLLSIFSHLPNISALFLREINWLNLDPSKAHILDLCRTPTLQSIDVWNCQFPCVSTLLDFLFSCKGIESLRLTHIRILNLSLNADHDLNTIVEKDTQLQNRNTLQSLAIDSMPIPPKLYTLLGTKGVIDFTRLRRLCLNNVTDPSTIRECLESSGKFLEHLELRTSPCSSFSIVSKPLTDSSALSLS